MGDVLLENYGIVKSPPIGNEARLIVADDVRKMEFYFMGKDLDDDFILSVAKANGYEVSKIGSIGTFENKAEVGSVHLFFLLERKVS